MLIPYSTDAPIYHYPWMTIGLIGVNTVTFVITGMGLYSQVWLLTFGHGLHPIEWIAYNFLHFGPLHLIGNMFFLWSFGIVVEGKLGWKTFLGVYLAIGILGGIIIQTAMLWYVDDGAIAAVQPDPPRSWEWFDQPAYAQDGEPEVPDMRDQGHNDLVQPQADLIDPELTSDEDVPIADHSPVGGGGASLVIYGLMAIVLVWAPRNELRFLWIGVRMGLYEIEYLYFCGFYIVTETLAALYMQHGFVASTQVGHAVGAMTGLAVGTLFLKQQWVDCENWDVFAIWNGTYGGLNRVGDWHTYYGTQHTEISTPQINDLTEAGTVIGQTKKRKKKLKPRLIELESIGDPFDSDERQVATAEPVHEKPKTESPWNKETKVFVPAVSDPPPKPKSAPPPIPVRKEPRMPARPTVESPTAPTGRVRQSLFESEFRSAFKEYLEHQSVDADYQLPQEELRMLANGLFKIRAVKDAAVMLEEYIRRYPADADKQRVKLAVLFVKFQRRPVAALRLLANLDPVSLPDDYRAIYQQAAREAQQQITEGVTDSA